MPCHPHPPVRRGPAGDPAERRGRADGGRRCQEWAWPAWYQPGAVRPAATAHVRRSEERERPEADIATPRPSRHTQRRLGGPGPGPLLRGPGLGPGLTRLRAPAAQQPALWPRCSPRAMRSALSERAWLRLQPRHNSPESWRPGVGARRRCPRYGRTDRDAEGPASGSEPGGARTDRVGRGAKSQPGPLALAGRAMALYVALAWRAAGLLLCRGKGAAARPSFTTLYMLQHS